MITFVGIPLLLVVGKIFERILLNGLLKYVTNIYIYIYYLSLSKGFILIVVQQIFTTRQVQEKQRE